MEEDKKQPAVPATTDPNTDPESPARGPGKTTDELLAEFDAEPTTTSERPAIDARSTGPTAQERIAELERRDRQREERDRLREVNDAVASCVSQVRAELPKDFKISERALRGWLDQLAIEDQRFAVAFAQRTQKPKVWSQIVKNVAQELTNEFGTQASEATRDAVSAAVRASATRTPEPETPFNEKDVRHMSEAQLREKFPDLNRIT